MSRQLKTIAVWLISGASLFSPSLHAAVQLGSELQGLLAYAREHNPDLLIRQAETKAAQARRQAVSEFPDPRLELALMDVNNAAGDHQSALLPGEVGHTRLSLSQTIPFWGKRGLRGELADTQAAQRETQWEQQWLQLQTEIKQAYARYYQAAEQLRIYDETLQLLDSLGQQVETRYGVGLSAQQDALRVYSESTAVKVQRLQAQELFDAAAARLNALLPRDPQAELAQPQQLPALQSWGELEPLTQQAREQHPQLQQQRLAIDAAEQHQALTYLNRYPDFTVAIRHNQMRWADNRWDLMVGVDIPVQQLVRRAQEREAEHNLQAARHQVRASEARLNGELGMKLAALNSSQQKIELLQHTLLPQAQASFESARAGYESGQVNFNTVLQAEQQVLQTRLSLLDARVQARIQQADLEQLLGRLD